MSTRRLTVSLSVIILALIAIDIASASRGDRSLNLSSRSDADLKTVTILLDRTACYGTCPAYKVTIHGDGRVEYTGEENVRAKGAREGRIEKTGIAELLSEFTRAKFLSISRDYSEEKCTCGRCTDMPTAITELRLSGITH